MKKHQLIGIFMTGCIASSSWALKAPQYLSVPNWKACVHVFKKESAEFICFPTKQPKNCPHTSWKTLKEGHMIEKCQE